MFFAEKLHQAMKGVRTCHETLVIIMVSRFEIDMSDTKTCYQKLYGISLCQVILDETKGDYEKFPLEDSKHSLGGSLWRTVNIPLMLRRFLKSCNYFHSIL